MAFLTIAGITVPVAINNATEAAPEEVGDDARTFNGTLRSTVRATKRGWRFTTKPITRTDVEAIRTACASSAQVTVNGDAVGNVAYTCVVKLGEVGYVKVRGGFRCNLPLLIRQV